MACCCALDVAVGDARRAAVQVREPGRGVDEHAQGEVERLLVDSPHYSQEGHAAFADTILPEVERLVFGQEAGM